MIEGIPVMACSCSKNKAQPTGFAKSAPREGAQATQRAGAANALRSGKPTGSLGSRPLAG
ncbi:hypothetical protein SEA_FUZZBUSTER_28 [Microbacterium phage FuzzBuster]|uniref:Uncharacterized protein n=1 Tax=Microbacterium phage FuzzBuster TaxID=2590935 RepID=A0A516KV09_9CAUD|nr:hypothetical protein SEA_FUZZBUSTER_28 [Microbacterium phage FuzzBuster]